jgi:signal transduction histidine kinase
MIGALPGTGQEEMSLNSQAQKPQHIHFDADLPFNGGPGGIVEDYHLAFRRALHGWLAPLVGLVLLSSAVVVLGLPFVFHSNLVRPLNRLLAGVRQIDAGHLEVHVPVQYGDEIGYLTHSFNTMAAELNGLVNDLESRVAARTRELDASQKEAEAANALLETVLNNLDTLIYVSDMDTYEILFANQKLQEVFGPVGGRICWQVLQDGKTCPCDFCANPLLIPPHNTTNLIRRQELQNTRNGRWYTTASSAVEWIDGRLVHLSMLVDITDIKQAEAQLLAKQVTVTVLEERQRLARDLHDSVTQSLYSLTLLAEGGRRLVKAGNLENAEDYFADLWQIALQSLKEMRLLIYELRPPVLEEEGLVGALQQRLDAVEGRTGMETRLLVDGEGQLAAPVEEALYRIAMEVLNNTLKHAAATFVTVRVRINDERAELEIVDDGRGFDPEAITDQGGMGLVTMRERTERLGGTLTILSVPGEGTRVEVTL